MESSSYFMVVNYTIKCNRREDKSMLTKQTLKYNSVNEYSKIRAQYHNEAEENSGTSEICIDKYGRLKSSKYTGRALNGDAKFYYQSGNGESSAAGKLASISDGFEGKNYKYSYDETGALVGWEQSKTNGENVLSVRQISASETKYSLGARKNGIEQYVPEKYKTQTVYDEHCTIDPRLTKTSVYYDSVYDDDEDDWKEIKQYTKEYNYDHLGRLDVTVRNIDLKVKTGTYRENYYYADGDTSAQPLINKIIRTGRLGSSTLDMETEIGYDENGRIKNYKETFSSSMEGTTESYTKNKEYRYDEAGRIIEETTNGYTQMYSYDEFGRPLTTHWGEKSYYDNGKNKGKLEQTNGEIYEYDNYGNRIRAKHYMYGDTLKQYEYERGNLLTKFTEWGRENSYKYNYSGQRIEKKTSDGVTTKYYLDGPKILGEDRTDGKQLRYFYDAQGICGFSYKEGNGATEYYTYVKDVFGNIIMIEDETNHWKVTLCDDHGEETVLLAAHDTNGSGKSCSVCGYIAPLSYELEYAAEANMPSDEWVYWSSGNACSGTYENGTVEVTFSGNTGEWWGTQVFYKDSAITNNTAATITMTVTSTESGHIQINGQSVELVAGEAKEITLKGAGGNALITVQMGVNGSGVDIEAATITFSNITITK